MAIGSIRALALAIGRSHTSCVRWTKRDDWSFGPAPWPKSIVERVKQWAKDTLRPGVPADPHAAGLRAEKLRQERRKISAQADIAEHSLAAFRASLIDAGDVEREWRDICATVARAVHPLPAQLASLATTHGMAPEASDTFEGQCRSLFAAALGHLETRNA